MNFENVKRYFENYFVSGQVEGIVKIIFDSLIVIGLIVLLLILFKIKTKVNIMRIVIFIIGLLVIDFIAILFGLMMVTSLIRWIFLAALVLFGAMYSQEIKAFLEDKKTKNERLTLSEAEQKQIIEIVCDTCEALSRRKVGAIITFEQRDSLDGLISKAIPIDSTISTELLSTIFYPGTPCHDGAVIIRNNRVACAGSYFPLSDNYEIPKSLGTRHRAAIGLSEKYDAVSIIVSEETGGVRITSRGNISEPLDKEKYKERLTTYLSSK